MAETPETDAANVAVVVTTEFRGVFFGWAAPDALTADSITLHQARNCIYWSAATGGVLGLAAEGPAKGSKIGATVDRIDLRKVTAVMRTTAAAVTAWEAANVWRG